MCERECNKQKREGFDQLLLLGGFQARGACACARRLHDDVQALLRERCAHSALWGDSREQDIRIFATMGHNTILLTSSEGGGCSSSAACEDCPIL